ncbi:neuropeptides capa receptor [Microplitis demolitor]|uniref:neuropeptides capa receptor n=1 Tax=Microplitis demolitor TaxID=69319 RepID=UPI0004CD2811|nr:neuropeptides capa receptor [Microplitis demolitor]
MEGSEESDFEYFWQALNRENLTEEEYLSRILGPKYLSLKLVIPLTLAYVSIFVTGVLGNVATCIVIIKNSSMHTSTNYYLFGLAISDLILLTLGLPNELSCIWQQYPWVLGVTLCKLRAYVSEMSSYVSVLTIVAFSMERYLAICHPLQTYTMDKPQRPIIIMFIAWSIALVSAVPFAIYTNVNYVEYPPGSGEASEDSAICAMLLPDMPDFPLYELSCVIFFLIPMIIILVVYTRMGLKIRNSACSTQNSMVQSAHLESRQIQSRKSIVRMLTAVVVMFFFCWAPFHAQRLLYVYAQEADYYPDLNEWLYILSGILYYFSTTVNPILYNLMSLRYRSAFKKTICFKKKSRRSQSFNNHNNSNNNNNNRSSHRDRNLCRCGSDRIPHRTNFKCTFRNTIDHAKEMFKSNSTRHEYNRGAKLPIDYNSVMKISDGNSARGLLINKHLPVDQQMSNESTSSFGNRVNETISTASSAV